MTTNQVATEPVNWLRIDPAPGAGRLITADLFIRIDAAISFVRRDYPNIDKRCRLSGRTITNRSELARLWLAICTAAYWIDEVDKANGNDRGREMAARLYGLGDDIFRERFPGSEFTLNDDRAPLTSGVEVARVAS